MGTAIYLCVVLARRDNRIETTQKPSKIGPILHLRKPSTPFFVNFMVSVCLSGFVHVIRAHHFSFFHLQVTPLLY